MSGYEDLVKRLGEGTAEKVLGLFAKLQAAEITEEQFVSLAADLVAGANVRGAAVSDMVIRAYLEQATGKAIAGVASVPASDPARLRKALGTILASRLDTEMQLRRLATSEVMQSSAEAYGESFRKYPGIHGWTRGMESDACQLCQWWSRDGQVWPQEHPMPRHKGCTCHQVPVVDKNIKSTMYSRKLEREQKHVRV